jgi:hypothetical protein
VAVEVAEPLFLVGFPLRLLVLLGRVELVQALQWLELTVDPPHTEVFLLKVELQVERLPLPRLL